MLRQIPWISLCLGILLAAGPVAAQTAGTAGGAGVILKLSPNPAPGATEPLSDLSPFKPTHSFAYKQKLGAKTYTWIVLTDQDPPLAKLQKAADPAEARRLWCKEAKAQFVAVMLEPDWSVNVYYLCPGTGNVNTEMVSTTNGLDSVVLNLTQRGDKRLAGTLRTGIGSCPSDEDGSEQAYCETTGDFTFDAPLLD